MFVIEFINSSSTKKKMFFSSDEMKIHFECSQTLGNKLHWVAAVEVVRAASAAHTKFRRREAKNWNRERVKEWGRGRNIKYSNRLNASPSPTIWSDIIKCVAFSMVCSAVSATSIVYVCVYSKPLNDALGTVRGARENRQICMSVRLNNEC